MSQNSRPGTLGKKQLTRLLVALFGIFVLGLPHLAVADFEWKVPYAQRTTTHLGASSYVQGGETGTAGAFAELMYVGSNGTVDLPPGDGTGVYIFDFGEHPLGEYGDDKRVAVSFYGENGFTFDINGNFHSSDAITEDGTREFDGGYYYLRAWELPSPQWANGDYSAARTPLNGATGELYFGVSGLIQNPGSGGNDTPPGIPNDILSFGTFSTTLRGRNVTLPEILSFGSGGDLVWTSDQTGLYYTVQWRPDLLDDDGWRTNYRSLVDIHYTGGVTTSAVPMFFRIAGFTQPQQTRELSPDTGEIQEGWYGSNNLAVVESDLIPGNIRAGISIFGVAGSSTVVDTSTASAESNDLVMGSAAWVGGVLVNGTRAPAPIPATGQTNSYSTGDDGELEIGGGWPSPRFIVNGDATVSDTLTGLIWHPNANHGTDTWKDALDYCNTLDTLGCDDWRLPNVRELYSLISYGAHAGGLPDSHPFSSVQSDLYWSSTSTEGAAWTISVGRGGILHQSTDLTAYVWPVRGGPAGE